MGRWWILFVTISKRTKLPLHAADFPLFPSPQSFLICLFICLWCYCLLLTSPVLAAHCVLMWLLLNILLVLLCRRLREELIRVSRSFVTALTSLVITSTLITVRSPFPLIWIIRIILVKGLWCRVFSKLSLALCLWGIFDGDKFEVWLQQVRLWLLNRCRAQCSRLQSKQGAQTRQVLLNERTGTQLSIRKDVVRQEDLVYSWASL